MPLQQEVIVTVPERVEVEWVDACRTPATFCLEDLPRQRQGLRVLTLGYVIDDGPEFLTISPEIWPDEESIREILEIPRGWLVKIRKLKFEEESCVS